MTRVSPFYRESALRTLQNAHFRREEVPHDEGQLFAMYPKKFPQVSLIDRAPQLHFSTLEKTKVDLQTHCTIPIPVEFDRPMSVSSGSGADVDMRVSSKRGIVEVESEPSWVSALMERMDQRLDANERRIELRMDERLDTNERRIEQVLGLHQTRLDKHDVELSAQRRLLEDLRSEIGDFRRSGVEQSRQFGEQSSETSSTAGSTNSLVQGEWCPRTVLVRGWAPYVSPASQKIDRVEYKKVANELLSCLPHSLQNNVVVRAPFAANFQISFGLKDGGGFDSCRAVQDALIAGVESNMITVRGHELKVSIELSPRKKITSTNMHRAAAFLKKSGVSPESYLLCHKSSRILSTMTKEDLGETPKGSNVWVWHSQKCSECGLSLTGWESFEN